MGAKMDMLGLVLYFPPISEVSSRAVSLRKQSKGGAIGNSLTEKLAKLLLKRFDRKFKALLKSLSIENELYTRYNDDILTALAALAPGTRFNKEENKMEIVNNLVESDKDEPADKRTFEELKKIANTIYNHVQFTTDSPSSHQAGMCPVLDLQMFV